MVNYVLVGQSGLLGNHVHTTFFDKNEIWKTLNSF